MQLIDGDMLKEAVEGWLYAGDTEYDDGFNDACEQFLSFLAGEAGCELKLVRRAHWKFDPNRRRYYCSICSHMEREKRDFCAGCGCIMKEVGT